MEEEREMKNFSFTQLQELQKFFFSDCLWQELFNFLQEVCKLFQEMRQKCTILVQISAILVQFPLS